MTIYSVYVIYIKIYETQDVWEIKLVNEEIVFSQWEFSLLDRLDAKVEHLSIINKTLEEKLENEYGLVQ